MKTLLYFFVILPSILLLQTESAAQAHRPVQISSGGGLFVSGSSSHSFTVGQCSAGTLSFGTGHHTAGYQQPWIYVTACLGDFDGNGYINVSDLLLLMTEFSCTSACATDLSGDGVVNIQDLLIFIGLFGSSCGV